MKEAFFIMLGLNSSFSAAILGKKKHNSGNNKINGDS